MKKLLIMLFGLVLLAACQPKAEACIEKLGDLIEKVAKEGEDFTEADWEAVSKEFEALVEEAQQIEGLTDEQKAEIRKLQGKFSGTVMKKGFDSLLKDGSEELEKIGNAIEGFIEGWEKEDAE